jgi:hypothetical protein
VMLVALAAEGVYSVWEPVTVSATKFGFWESSLPSPSVPPLTQENDARQAIARAHTNTIPRRLNFIFVLHYFSGKYPFER